MDTSHLASLSIGLIYGTDTGNTEEVAGKIKNLFAKMDSDIELIDVVDYSRDKVESFDFIIMGIPTWDFGGIQEDWEDKEDELLATDFNHRVVALYGLGDQFGYADYFLDAMGWLHKRVIKAGASVVGFWSTEGYDFTASLAANDDKSEFCGLGIDEDQQFELSDERISSWVEQIVGELRLKQGLESAASL